MMKKVMYLIILIEIVILTIFKQELTYYITALLCTIIHGGTYILFGNKIYELKEKKQIPINATKLLCLSICLSINFLLSIIFELGILLNVKTYLLIIILNYLIFLLILTLVKTNQNIVDKSIKEDDKINKWTEYTSKIKLLNQKYKLDELKQLYEKMRYSDPVNLKYSKYDEKIFEMINNLDSNNLETITKIEEKINERNEMIKNSK